MTRDREILAKARALIAERGWCQRALARDRNGRMVDPLSDEAAEFCPHGAIVRAAGWDQSGLKAAYTRLRLALDGEPVGRWADNRNDVREVLAAFDDAIGGLGRN
jgi:hypothetical protein